jgi:hypothetical protein
MVSCKEEGKYIVYFALTELSDVWFNPKPKTIQPFLLKI